ncbi:HAD family phosphatase [Desulfosporosinus sp. PR]|uniref:HAD family hydrolase n=1 Tax=Candidatus Desulfosporosinus nitrosoreducens TaxID=3401928 RepID=UPI0027EBC438|nr:HAD family phosphatase [Desulfosporosinus sp. PR]MDQ7096479.1 HAD family phosphatase [Desulfosporosinus sp. PR]
MIKNIIFDLGNVLINFKPLDYVCTQIADYRRANEVYQSIFKSPEWLMLDRGIVTEKEAINAICERTSDLNKQIRLVMTDWYHMLTPMEDVLDIVKELKSVGHKIYFLSNYQLLAYEHVRSVYSVFNYFDGGVFSFEEKSLKPEPEIYEKLIKRYAIEPHESIFIDDTKDNVESASIIGFNAILFTSSIKLREELRKYNVLKIS